MGFLFPFTPIIGNEKNPFCKKNLKNEKII